MHEKLDTKKIQSDFKEYRPRSSTQKRSHRTKEEEEKEETEEEGEKEGEAGARNSHKEFGGEHLFQMKNKNLRELKEALTLFNLLLSSHIDL